MRTIRRCVGIVMARVSSGSSLGAYEYEHRSETCKCFCVCTKITMKVSVLVLSSPAFLKKHYHIVVLLQNRMWTFDQGRTQLCGVVTVPDLNGERKVRNWGKVHK